EVGGKEAEHRAASSVKEAKGWSYERWTTEVTKVLVAIENAIWPDLFIVGGGISRKADKWVPLLQNRTPVVAAELQNTAGIVGAGIRRKAGKRAPRLQSRTPVVAAEPPNAAGSGGAAMASDVDVTAPGKYPPAGGAAWRQICRCAQR